MKFDPMTGEPIEEGAQPETKKKTVTKYDPMTGEPIQVVVEDEPEVVVGKAQPLDKVAQIAQSFIQLVKAKPAILGVVAVVAVVIIAFASGIFMSDRDRVAMAIVNTINDRSDFGDSLVKLAEVYTNKETTTAITVEYAGVEVIGEYRHTSGEKQLWAKLNGSGVTNIEATLTLTKEQLQGNTPLLEDTLLVYNYTEENDGYIMDELSVSEQAVINNMLTMVARIGETEIKIDNAYIKELKEWYKEIEIEKEDKEEFEINGRDKKCAGYTMEIDGDMLVDLCDIVFDMADDTEGLEALLAYEPIYEEDIRDRLKNMESFDVTFYLDSNKLAAIVISVDDEELEILFEGGAYRAQNVKVKMEGETVLRLEGETEGKVETLELEVGGQKIAEYEYNAKTGEFELALINYYGEEFVSVETVISTKGGAVTLSDGTVKVDGVSVDFELSAKKGANIQKLSGDEFDIGEASYRELMELAEELTDELY